MEGLPASKAKSKSESKAWLPNSSSRPSNCTIIERTRRRRNWDTIGGRGEDGEYEIQSLPLLPVLAQAGLEVGGGEAAPVQDPAQAPIRPALL